MGVKWYVIVALICISLIANDIEHLFMSLLATWVSLEKYLLESFAHLKIVLFVFLLLRCKSSLYNLGTNSYQLYDLQIFSSILWVVFLLSWWYPLKHKSF